MILVFPNSETLHMAITSATLPEEILRAPAEAGTKNDLIYVQSAEKLSRADSSNLKLLGVKAARKAPIKLTDKVTCWHQLIPIQRVSEAEEVSDRTAVLFVTNHHEQLVDLVSEMMRLGNDRQSYRYLNSIDKTATLLRVVGPPYYSLLRAIEPATVGNNTANGLAKNGAHAIAFVERSPRVWIQFGYRHPTEEQILAPVGQQILLSSDGDWQFIDEAPYNDVYKALETHLPSIPSQLVDNELPKRMEVLLQLANSGAADEAEFWVLRENSVEQIEQLIERSDDQLLGRLSFAVAGQDENTTVVIRTRPSKLAPPILVLKGVSFRSFLKLPNLFLPVGKRLHPPLRRDAVGQLLASESQLITWLYPEFSEDGHQTNSFQVQQIADSAFQPLSNWIDYIMDRESESLAAWSNSYSFEFEPFVSNEDKPKKPKPPRKRGERDDLKSNQTESFDVDSAVRETKAEYKTDEPKQVIQFTFDPDGDVEIQPNELQVQLEDVENRFFELDDPVDGKERRKSWMEMAPLNAGLIRRHDATVCWSNAFWDSEDENPFEQWLATELQCSEIKSVQPIDLKKLIKVKSNRPNDGSLIAAYLAWAAHQAEPPRFVTNNLGDLTQFLQRQELFLPVRTAWIAWFSLYQLSDGDVLSLARARDRMLERLFQNGLTPEFDMPSFLRAKGMGSNDRFRVLGEQINELAESVGQWITEPELSQTTAQTREYAKLTFAFGLARLGETSACKGMTAEACEALAATENPVHIWLAKAYEERIVRTMNAETQQGTLSDDLVRQVDTMGRLDGYIINRLRSQSRILEPVERIDAFLRWHRRYTDELEQQLTELTESTDRDRMQSEFAVLLKQHRAKSESHSRVMGAALQVAPKMSEQFSNQLVGSVIDSFAKSKDAIDKAMLLQKAMFAAAHFGRVDAVQSLVHEFESSLPAIVASYLQIQITNEKEKAVAVELLFTESFQGLRKLGMRDEIGRLYGNIASLVQEHTKQKKKSRKKNQPAGMDATRHLRLLLCVAGGWYYFGQYEEANAIADQVREVLLTSKLDPSEKKNLACAYVKAAAMAPPEQARGRIAEIFALDKKGKPVLSEMTDAMSTKTHFQIFQLDIIESTLLALVNDEYSLNAESRRWLDEDEFIVRSRIHRDVQMATK